MTCKLFKRHTQTLLHEDFNAGLDSTIWSTGYWWGDVHPSNGEEEVYTPNNVLITADGCLALQARQEIAKGSDGNIYTYTSGMISTGPTNFDDDAQFAFKYGIVEARLRLPAGQGLWPAFWMLPADREIKTEIDILEVLGHEPDRVYSTLHFGEDWEQAINRIDATQWHTYKLLWTKKKLVWSIDDTTVFVQEDHVPQVPMYLILNLAVGGYWPGSPGETTQLPATMLVDYITVRQ